MATFEVSNNVFIKALSMNSLTLVLALSTGGKFVDKNISVNISVPTATFIATSTNGTLNSTYVASNITTTSTNNFNNDISIAYSATATGSTYYISSNTAGYINASTTVSSGSIADQSTTATYYIQGVTLNKPASGEAKFSITVPNGESNDMITFVFHVDPSGNVVVDDSTDDTFVEPTYTCIIRSSNSNNQNSSVTYNNNVYYTTGNSFTYHAGDNLFIQGTASQTDVLINIWNVSNLQYNGASHNLYASYNYTLPALNIIIDIDAGIFTEINVYELAN